MTTPVLYQQVPMEREPIAIIGIGCRFPGVQNVREFWRVLAEGKETVGEYPGGRFPYIDTVYRSGSAFSDRIATDRGGFFPDLDRFDADFFGISPREAELLDPQQRLLLEVAWEAIDDAGLVRERLAGSRTGVFVGVWTSDYEDCLYEYSPSVDFHATTGGGRYGVSGRLAYVLDLRGPNLTIDTACSSSLVAIHLACQSLLTGESSLAIAGGVNAILRPEITLVYSDAGMLAPDGRCKFGDAAADGYVRSEGAGALVLKRLSQAIADRDPIYAVIRGSAVNNDGHSSGLLVSPSREGQEDVIRTALASANISPDEVDYVEAHGTGTLTGDPVEIETIGKVMTSSTRSYPCAIGSVKTNIGHTESAAGIAGVAKVALSLQRGILPASLHFQTPSPRIAWNEFQVTVPTVTAPWPGRGEGNKASVAGVSGFGITGTNAHLVLEAFSNPRVPHNGGDAASVVGAGNVVDAVSPVGVVSAGDAARTTDATSTTDAVNTTDAENSARATLNALRGHHDSRQASSVASEATQEWPLVFALSAQTPDAVRDLASHWRTWIADTDDDSIVLSDIAYTAAIRRTQHSARLVVAARNPSELEARLADWLEGDEQSGVASGQVLDQAPHRAVFVYPGQGGQWAGMGRILYERSHVFRASLERCDAAIKAHAGWSVIDVLLGDDVASKLQEIDVVQPTLFAVMIALTDVWRSLGVEPLAVVGHSMGEAAAAVVAGALSLEDGAAVICHRSKLMKRVRGRGLMAVVELSLAETRDAIRDVPGVWIGASNSATSTVVSGDAEAIERLIIEFEARDIFCRRIQVDVASHSGHIDEIREELEAQLIHIKPTQSHIPLYSTTTGAVEDGTSLDASYWGKNLRQSVLFHPAVELLLGDGFDTFVEINAHPVLTHALQGTVRDMGVNAVVTGTLRRESDEQLEVLGAFGRLHAAGYPVQLERVVSQGNCVSLPSYPWQRERYWFVPPDDAVSLRQQTFGAQEHNGAGVSGSVSDDTYKLNPVPAECLYELEWVQAPIQTSRAQTSGAGHWLVLSNGVRGDTLAHALVSQGATCVIVRAGSEYRTIDATTVEIDSVSDDHFSRLIREQTTPVRGIVHAWSVDDDTHLPDASGVLLAQTRGTLSALHLVRASAEHAQSAGEGMSQPATRIWLLTHGAHAVASEPITTPWDASLLGFGRVAAAEHSDLQVTNLDLSAEPESSELAYASQLIMNGVLEQQIAIRGLRQFYARYRRASVTRSTGKPNVIRADATYLITGGLGGIGIQTAQWLVAQGARHLVLAGRRGASEKAKATLAELEAKGVRVQVVSADISDPEQAERLTNTNSMQMPPLAGIFHMAVVVDHALISEASDESFYQVFGPKMLGAWNLYLALRDKPLDFYVLFSSMVDVIPQPRSASYAAANAFLDALARYGATRKTPIQSIQWEPWAGTGLMNEAKTRGALRMYEAQGVRPMSPALGFEILGQALNTPSTVLLAAAIDWTTYASVCADDAGATEFSRLTESAAKSAKASGFTGTTSSTNGSSPATAEPSTSDIRATLAQLPAGRPRLGALETYLREQLAAVLRTAPERLDLQKPMGNMGVDSLLALEFVRRLSRTLEIKVPATVVFNYPTIKKLAVLLESKMGFADMQGETSADSAQVVSAAAQASSNPVLTPSETSPTANADDFSELDAIHALRGRKR